jgi:DNA repair protein RadC
MYRIPIYRIKLVREGSLATERRKVGGPAIAADVLHQYFEGADREHFVVLLLDTRHRVIGINTVTVGVLDASLIHPREIFKPAILANAAAIILAHNHPSGDPNPSPEDRAVTRQIAAAGRLMGIPILDHLIIGDRPRYISLHDTAAVDFDAQPVSLAA